MRAAALGLAAWIVAGCTWAALDLTGADAREDALPTPGVSRAVAVARGEVSGRYGQNVSATPGAPTERGGIRLTIVDGGWPTQLSVQPGTVLDVLRSCGYALGPFDRVDGALSGPLVPGMILRIVR